MKAALETREDSVQNVLELTVRALKRGRRWSLALGVANVPTRPGVPPGPLTPRFASYSARSRPQLITIKYRPLTCESFTGNGSLAVAMRLCRSEVRPEPDRVRTPKTTPCIFFRVHPYGLDSTYSPCFELSSFKMRSDWALSLSAAGNSLSHVQPWSILHCLCGSDLVINTVSTTPWSCHDSVH